MMPDFFYTPIDFILIIWMLKVKDTSLVLGLVTNVGLLDILTTTNHKCWVLGPPTIEGNLLLGGL
jgi:hypothetical protein